MTQRITEHAFRTTNGRFHRALLISTVLNSTSVQYVRNELPENWTTRKKVLEPYLLKFDAAHWTRKHEWTDRSRTFLNYQSTPCIALQAYYSLNAVRFSLVSAPMQFFPTCNIRFSSTSPVPSWSIRFARSASVPFSTGCSEQALSITHQHI